MNARCTTCQGVLAAATPVDDARCERCRELPVPERIGRYPVVRLLGRGGMGAVWLARHPELETLVAIKVADASGQDIAVKRFLREAKLTASLDHPGVVRVHDLVRDEDHLCLVMDYVDGTTLAERLARDPPTVEEAVRIAADVADVLAVAHEAGVVHRDVKPSNIMLDRHGTVRVLDFGISRGEGVGETVTRTGEILGTPEYMAPEQILDAPEDVDGRADIYALGVILYEALTGERPFDGPTVFHVLKRVESHQPPSPSGVNPGASDELGDLVLAAMSKERDRRPASASAFAERLREFLPGASVHAGERSGAHWVPVIMVGAILAAVVCGLAYAKGRQHGRGDLALVEVPESPVRRPLEDLRDLLASAEAPDLPAIRSAVRTAMPDDPDAAIVVARGWRQLGELTRSREVLAPWTTDSPAAFAEWAVTRALECALWRQLGDVPRVRDLAIEEAGAIEAAVRRRGLDPDHPGRRLRLAFTVLTGGERGDGPSDQEALASLGDVFLRLALTVLTGNVRGEAPIAETSLDRVLLIDVLLMAGRSAEATQMAERLARARPGCVVAELAVLMTRPVAERMDGLVTASRWFERTAPERYLAGLVLGILRNDRSQRRAHLELAAASGAPDEALALFVAAELRHIAEEGMYASRRDVLAAELDRLASSPTSGVRCLRRALALLGASGEAPAGRGLGMAWLDALVGPAGAPTPAWASRVPLKRTVPTLLAGTSQFAEATVTELAAKKANAWSAAVVLHLATGRGDAVEALAWQLLEGAQEVEVPPIPVTARSRLAPLIINAHQRAVALGADDEALAGWTAQRLRDAKIVALARATGKLPPSVEKRLAGAGR